MYNIICNFFKNLFRRHSAKNNNKFHFLDGGLLKLLNFKKLDKHILHDVYELLIRCNIGSEFSKQLIDAAQNELPSDANIDQVNEFLSEKIKQNMEPYVVNFKYEKKDKIPFVLFICGVNGNGKTTTIGKLAAKYIAAGNKTMLVACDVFRAAADLQLKFFAEKTGANIFIDNDVKDAASIAYKAILKAKEENYDIVVIDTAGRMHNQKNLMDQLKKIQNVIGKIDQSIPDESILVIDANTGQVADSQIRLFTESIKLTGIIVTKMDSGVKSGILLKLVSKYKLPICAISSGEGIDDLYDFELDDFVQKLIFG